MKKQLDIEDPDRWDLSLVMQLITDNLGDSLTFLMEHDTNEFMSVTILQQVHANCEMENKPSVEATTNMTSGFEGRNWKCHRSEEAKDRVRDVWVKLWKV